MREIERERECVREIERERVCDKDTCDVTQRHTHSLFLKVIDRESVSFR